MRPSLRASLLLVGLQIALAVTGCAVAESETVAAVGTPSPAVAAQDFGITNALEPEDALLFAGQPSEEQLRQVAERGYSVVNLRMPDEDAGFSESALADELGVDYYPVPVDRAALDDPETYSSFYRALDEAARPTLVHCASGNRVGALYYAYLVERGGKQPDEALAIARESGLRSDALAEAVSRYLESRPTSSPQP